MYFDAYNYVLDNYSSSSLFTSDIALIRRGILIDTAPLFVLVVGNYDKINNTHFIRNFQSKSSDKKKTYESFDYDYLLAFLNSLGLGKYNLRICLADFWVFLLICVL